MKNMTFVIKFWLLTGLTCAAFGQQAGRPYTLRDCIKYTAENNSGIVSAKIQEKIADKKVAEVIGSGLPQVRLNGNLVNNLELPAQIIPGEFFGMAPGSLYKLKFGTKFNSTLSGQLNQMIFNGSFWVGLDAAQRSEEYYRSATEAAADKAFYSVGISFYKTLMAEKQIKLLGFNLASVEKTLADTRLRRDNGKARDIDVDRLRVNRNNLKHQLQNLNEQVQQAYNELKYLMGMPVSVPLTIADSAYDLPQYAFGSLPTPDSITAGQNNYYEDRADFRQLLTARELQNLNRKNEWMQYVPSLSAYGSYTWSAQKNSFSFKSTDWMNYYSIGLQLSMPLFTGGQTYARIQQAELALRQIDEQVTDIKRGIDMQSENARIAYKKARLAIESETENVELARKVYTVTEVEYNEGVSTASALVDAETKLREAQTNYINSLLNLHIAKIEIEKAKGTITSFLLGSN